jgi:hypothetical protein
MIIAKAVESNLKENKDDEGDPGGPKASNKGKLLLDGHLRTR